MDTQVSFTTDEGYEYLIVFQELTEYSTAYNISIVDVSILPLSKDIEANSYKSLAHFISVITAYLRHNPETILYYYCDTAPIKMRKNRKECLSPQEFRNNLFTSLFKRTNPLDFDLFDIIVKDTATGNHYTSLISHKKNHKKVHEIIFELKSLLQKGEN